MKHHFSLALLGAAALAGACERPSSPTPRAPEPSAPAAELNAARGPGLESPVDEPEAKAAGRSGFASRALITDRDALRSLERAGFDLAALLGEPKTSAHKNKSTKELSVNPRFRAVARTLKTDVEQVRSSDRYAGEELARFSHRLFDMKWLASEQAQFELVALVNRLDRRPFHGDNENAPCGEVRLIYRLTYEKRVFPERAPEGVSVRSRLPMTIGLEFAGPSDASDPNCQRAASRFSAPDELRGVELAAWLSGPDGPLGVARADNKDVQLVVNLQVVRWPSTVHPAMAGHAEYVLRAFRPEGEALLAVPLENTPDVGRLLFDLKKKKEIARIVSSREALKKIDEGTFVLPEAFLATKDVSVTPRGFSRHANRPYRTLLQASDFSEVSFEGLSRVKSPEALIRRLDELTCSGCHQARSVAGFHVLGEDGPEEAVGNALVMPVSPHVEQDLPRRRRLLEAVVEGDEPDYSREFAERADGRGGYGAHCGLNGEFSDWTCDEGLYCDPYDAPRNERYVGICLPEGGPLVGDPCEVGSVRPHPGTADNGRRDRVENVRRKGCVNAACNRNSVGFPGGLCRSTCENPGPHGTCGAIALLGPFNACLARGEPFSECLKFAAPAGLRSCGPGDPCRDDFICARKEGNEGMCLPPYFLFQLRVDGH